MRIHYVMMPTDYVQELQASGRRFKARCFMEYFADLNADAVNSFGFYAKSWGGDKPMSKGTVHKWIGEFVNEIDRFFAAHQLKNNRHYTSVKNKSERRVNGKRTDDRHTAPKKSASKKTARTGCERGVNEDNNLYDDDGARSHAIKSRLFDDLYMIYRMNTEFAGAKDDALREYERVDIDHRQLIRSIVMYLHDPDVEKKYNFANFLRNQIYLNYIDKRIRVVVGDEWVTGVNEDEAGVFTADDGRQWRLTPETLATKLADGDLEFVIGAAA